MGKKIWYGGLSFCLVFVCAWFTASWLTRYEGKALNAKAWESSYRERGLVVPADGPHEGYWGDRLGKKVPDVDVGWHEPNVTLPGLMEIDKDGFQFYRSTHPPAFRILILGGSVAFGAYASTMQNTYFNVIGKELEIRGLPVEILVFAASAWKSTQELKALQTRPGGVAPDLIVFINGLNDLTNGATSRHLYAQPFAVDGVEEQNPYYHARDYEQRVDDYLANMTFVRDFAEVNGIKSLVVLQPSLAERSRRTEIEEELLAEHLEILGPVEPLLASYERMRQGLRKLEGGQTRFFVFSDCSRIFDDEHKTIFSDIWHFSDIGHGILGRNLADRIATLLNQANGSNVDASQPPRSQNSQQRHH
jgi:hypothetical protein